MVVSHLQLRIQEIYETEKRIRIVDLTSKKRRNELLLWLAESPTSWHLAKFM